MFYRFPVRYRATYTPLAEACDRECVTPLPSPMTNRPLCSVSRFWSMATSMLLAETPSWAGILSCWLPIVYAGVFSGGVGYTLQILGQRDTQPAVASLLMSLESFFAALFGWLLLGQALTPRELFGCFLMLAAVVLAQLPDRRAAAQSLRR